MLHKIINVVFDGHDAKQYIRIILVKNLCIILYKIKYMLIMNGLSYFKTKIFF